MVKRKQHDHNKIAPCGMIKVFELNGIEHGWEMSFLLLCHLFSHLISVRHRSSVSSFRSNFITSSSSSTVFCLLNSLWYRLWWCLFSVWVYLYKYSVWEIGRGRGWEGGVGGEIVTFIYLFSWFYVALVITECFVLPKIRCSRNLDYYFYCLLKMYYPCQLKWLSQLHLILTWMWIHMYKMNYP